ncbi:MAG: cation-transporting P-type ATPase, partial [Patescibacteria group bacterium]
MPWHSLTIEQIFRELKTNENGPTFDEIAKRQKRYGRNK